MRSRLLLPLLIAVFSMSLLGGASVASAWAPEESATIHPGVMTFTNASSFLGGASQCTANFVYTDASGNVYLGQAAHCSSTGEDTETNGCTTKSLPLGTSIYSGDVSEDTETNGCTTKSLPLRTSLYSGDVVNGGVQ